MSDSHEVSTAEGIFLFSLASQVPDGAAIVEIGSYRGASAVCLAEGAPPNAIVYCIDLWESGLIAPFNEPATHEEFNCATHAYNNIVAIEGCSIQVAPTFDDPIALLFIDAQHEYEPVKADLDAWSPKVTGTIVLHDYSDSWPGVMQAADELEGWHRYAQVETSVALRKDQDD